MRKIMLCVFFVFVLAIGGPVAGAGAVSYYDPDRLQEVPLAVTETGIPAGKKIYLFFSSATTEMLSEIDEHTVLTVYRENPAGCPSQPRETGKIRLDSVAADHYAEAEVLSGNVREGDVVQGNTAAYLVTSAMKRCHR
jgi:hypothetical protein